MDDEEAAKVCVVCRKRHQDHGTPREHLTGLVDWELEQSGVVRVIKLSGDSWNDRAHSNQSGKRSTSPTVGCGVPARESRGPPVPQKKDEEQVDLFSMVARADEGEGLRPVGHTGDGSRIVLGLGSALMGIYACFERFSSMKQLSVPESTRNATGRESWPQSRVLLRTRWEEQGGQEETALGSTPACAGMLTLLAACDR